MGKEGDAGAGKKSAKDKDKDGKESREKSHSRAAMNHSQDDAPRPSADASTTPDIDESKLGGTPLEVTVVEEPPPEPKWNPSATDPQYFHPGL